MHPPHENWDGDLRFALFLQSASSGQRTQKGECEPNPSDDLLKQRDRIEAVCAGDYDRVSRRRQVRLSFILHAIELPKSVADWPQKQGVHT